MSLDNRARIEGFLKVENFQVQFQSFKGETSEVTLTSAGVWLVLQGSDFEERVVFVEQNDRPLINGKKPLEIPSGKVDPNDNNIWETLLRELYEETGIEGIKENIQPLVIALKGDNASYSDSLIPLGIAQDFWINNSTFLFSKEKHTGGLIGLYVTQFAKTPFASFETQCRKHSNQILELEPPNSVDQKEISKIVLIPVDMVLNGIQDVKRSSHPWAHASGLQAFAAASQPNSESFQWERDFSALQ